MRITIPKVHGSTPREKLIRSLALMLVFAAVVWAFSKNNAHVVEVLNQQSSVYDETGTLDNEQKKFIISFVRTLRDEFGVEARIQIYGGDFSVPDINNKTLYIGLAPSINEVQLRFPPLMQQALGNEFIEKLKTDHFLPSFQYKDWQEEIQVVLVAIFDKLNQINQGTQPSE